MKKIFFINILFLLFACKHQEEIIPHLNPTPAQSNSCDTTSVSYSKDIKPVLKQYCYSCHSGSAAINGYDFEDFNFVQMLALDPAHYIPNVMIDTLRMRMPPSPNSLPDNCSIKKMKAWVNQGALNN